MTAMASQSGQTQGTKLRSRGARTFRENARRSCVAFPITSEGYLLGAITAYSHRPDRELVGIRNDFCATLSFTLQGLLRSRQESIRIEELEANFEVLYAHLCGSRRLRSTFWLFGSTFIRH
jgi:hypothetical protein